MNAPSTSPPIQVPQLSLLDKTVTLISWGLVGTVFLTVGWLAMEPDDPLGAVSLLSRAGAVGVVVQAMALAGVAAAVATLLAGRLLADVGTFATAIGLTAVSLRGGTAQALLVDFADASYHSLAAKLAVESVAWLVVMCTAVAVSGLVMHWCFGRADDSNGETADPRAALARATAARDLPRIGGRVLGCKPDQATALPVGIRHTVITSGLALAAIGVLSAGLSSRSIQHGQECFVVAAGVCIACYFAHRMVPVQSALWSILAVGLTALVAYLWAGICPAGSGLPPNIPPSHFLRVLPLQFISVGTAAAVAMFWYVYAPEPPKPPRRKTAREGGS